jgi:hypothetical protein
MLTIRRNEDIYATEGGWFSARWHFSFDQYRDPEQMGFGPLRVFNDDRLIPGAIWPMHPHRDIEGITYVVEGTFRHADSLGNGGVLPPGSIQRATLGSGMQHSEQNGSDTEPMRFLQFWILPHTASLPPSNEQRVFTTEDRTGTLLRVVGPEGGDVVKVHQDASVYIGRLTPGTEATHQLPEGRGAYVYLIDGRGAFNGTEVRTGDAARVRDEDIAIRAETVMEVILVDLPMEWQPVGVWAR